MLSCSSPTYSHAAGHVAGPREVTVLHQIVKEYLEPLVRLHEQQGHPLQPFILREFERFIECGDVSLGYVAVFCRKCGELRSVPLACKRRGWCPRCLGRRMIDRGTFLTDRVIGDTPVRHLTLTFPPPLRYYLPYDPALVTELLSATVEAVFSFLRWKAKKTLGLASVNDAHPGAVTSIQRCSSNLDSNVHFHILATDGVFVREVPDGPVSFRELPAPTDEEMAEIAWQICLRTRDILLARGLWRDVVDESDGTFLEAGESKQAPAQRLHGVLSLGPHRRECEVTYFGRATMREEEDQGGYSFDLYGRRCAGKGDHERLARLTQYILHPPLTDKQLTRGPDGRVVLELDWPRRDGTRQVVFEPLEFLNKLVALIPRPRSNLIRFHGVYASNARLRDEVVPKVDDLASPGGCDDPSDRSRRMSWAELLARIYGIDLNVCPRCSSQVQVVLWFVDRYGRKHPLRGAGLPGDSPDHPPADAPVERVWIH